MTTTAQLDTLAKLHAEGVNFHTHTLTDGRLLVTEGAYRMVVDHDGTVGTPLTGTPADQVRAVVEHLGHGVTGAWIGFAELRHALPHLDRATVDTALRTLADQPGVHVTPEVNQKTLTPADRAAALRIGGENKHLISILPD